MAARPSGAILRLIGRVFDGPSVRQSDDQELLRHFLERRDDLAFEALVRRHGLLVRDVCRSVLPNEADVEDAFQSTFLILAQKGASIRKAGSLASWLHGVAYRTACRARTSSARRARHETRIPARESAEASDDLAWREVRQIVHEELSTLSERYRSPLLLCYLEGRKHDEASASLGIARSTLKERLERGRALLRSRLVRRGLGPSALVVTAAWPYAAKAGLPASIVSSTVKCATAMAAGAPTTSAISAEVAALVKGGMSAMKYATMKTAIGLVLGIGTLGACAAALAIQLGQAGGDSPPSPPGSAREAFLLPAAQVANEKALADREAAAARKALAALQAKKADPKQDDERKLRGAWIGVSGTLVGEPMPAETARSYRLTFTEGNLTMQFRGESKEGKYKLDPTATPKAIDLDLEDGSGLGIYSLDGDELKLCITESGKGPRPSDFTAEADKENRKVLMVFKRAADAQPAGAAGKNADDQIESRQVAALKEQVRALEAVTEALKQHLKRSQDELRGVLTKLDAQKKTLSFRLKGTTLTLDAVPLSGDVKFVVGDRDATIEEMKPGMPISLEVRTEGERTVVTAVMAPKPDEP